MGIHPTDGLVLSLFERVEVTCPIIFVTAYEEYALKASEVDSIDHPPKPIKGASLQRVLEKVKRFNHTEQGIGNQALMAKMMQVLNESQMSYKSHFLIPWRDKLIPIPVDKIAYIRAGNKASMVVMTDRKERFVDLSLEKMARELSPRLLLRTNRQYIAARSVIQNMSVWFGGELTVILDIGTPEKTIVNKAKNKESKEWYQGAYDPDTKQCHNGQTSANHEIQI